MKLSQLLQGIPTNKITGCPDIDINGIASDSRQVRPGYLFVAVKGRNVTGYQFIEEARKRGAAAVIADKEYPYNKSITLVIVDSPHNTLCQLASRFYGNPGSKLKLFGITGTNGKTTTSYLIHSIFKKAGIKTGLLGTIDYILGEDRKIPSVLTTPDVLSLNRFLGEMCKTGCSACVMEVSSQALDQGRTDGIPYKVAVFTNFSRDHLDYHNTEGKYLETKAKLFRGLSQKGWAVVNLDDPYHNIILQNTLAKVAGYGIRNVYSSDTWLKIKARAIKFGDCGTKFSVDAKGFGARFSLETSLIGVHNIYNILAAVGVALCQGIPIISIQEGILSAENIPGRFQQLKLGQPFKIIIDYAHTPDALENILNTISNITTGKIILIFGCGGNRDKDKRPIMGRIASQKADYVFLTTDNPRQEEPGNIIEDIKRGFVNDNYKVIASRKDAIIEGLCMASLGDSVVIAGKGHENYQVLKDTVVPFSDKAVVENFLSVEV